MVCFFRVHKRHFNEKKNSVSFDVSKVLHNFANVNKCRADLSVGNMQKEAISENYFDS